MLDAVIDETLRFKVWKFCLSDEKLEINEALDMQPIDPNPCNEEVSCGVEILFDIPDDMQPIDPNPCNEEVSCGVEIIFDIPDDKQPIEPKPTKELVSCGVEIILDKDKEDR